MNTSLNENFLPGSMTGKLSFTNTPQTTFPRVMPQAPTRSRALADLMAQKTGPDVSDYATAATKAGSGLLEGYKDLKDRPEGLVDDPAAAEARKDAGYASIAGGVASGLGAALPGWYGKIAQLAGMLTSEYGKQKGSDVRGQMLAKIASESDPDKRARLALLLGSQ